MDKILQITDKFLLSSLLQKSIRLGLTQATENTVATLYAVDKNYLMYRMMIIAFEDIGAANMDLMKKITQYRWGVRNFKERNVDFLSYFQALGRELCESPKDRTACDSTYLLKKAHMCGDLEQVLKDPTLKQIWEGWRTLGFKRYVFDEHIPKQETEDNIEAFISHATTTTDSDCGYLQNFYTTQVDPFFLSTPYLHAEIEKSLDKIEDLPASAQPMDFVWSAIDGHTRIGAASLQQLIKENLKSFNEILRLSSSEQIYPIVKMLLFRVEGQNIQHKVFYDAGQRIKNLTQQKEHEYYFPDISWAQYLQTGKLLKSLLPHLNDIRTKQLGFLLAAEASLPKKLKK